MSSTQGSSSEPGKDDASGFSNLSLGAHYNEGAASTSEMSLDDLPTYKYKPVDTGKFEFRLFCLYPHGGTPASPVHGDIIHARVADKPDFKWLATSIGPKPTVATLVVDRCKLRVPSVIEAALRAIRDADNVVTVWCEMVCIDILNIRTASMEIAVIPHLQPLCSGMLDPFKMTPTPADVAGPVPKLTVMNDIEVTNCIYQPLADEANEVRLVNLAPRCGEAASKVECTLLSIPLDGEVEFYALSYTWGSREEPAVISLEGQDFRVTRNLEKALQRLRKEDEDLLIWIDALCINQYDVHERNAQVRKMRDIYRSATRLLVWLGDNDHMQINQALDSMELLEERPAEYWKWSSLPSEEQFKKKVPVWGSINWFFRQIEWFNRAWVIQEVASAKLDPLTYCGSRQVAWSRLRYGARHVVKDYPGLLDTITRVPGPDQLSDHTGVLRMDSYRSLIRTGRVLRIGQLLVENRVASSADPRDKLYALLGLASDGNAEELTPDYAKPLSQVFKELFRYVVTRDKRLDLICASQPVGVPTIPCWIPNWHEKWRYSTIGLRPQTDQATDSFYAGEQYGEHPRYHAAGDTEADCYMSDGNGSCFRAKGTPVGPLSHIGVPSYVKYQIPDEWKRMVENHKEYAGKEFPRGMVEDLFWRTLVADSSSLADRSPSIWQLCCQVWLGRTTEARSGLTPNNMARWHEIRERATHNRGLGILANGLLGLFPLDARAGDWLCILRGCSVPVLLRRNKESNIAHFVGDCYVAGLMQGEMLPEFRRQAESRGEQLMSQVFHLH